MLRFFLINFYATFCYALFDYSITKMITINDTNSFFGYSLLLQTGDPSVVIVGAPRKNYGFKNTGSIYRCDLNQYHCDDFNKIVNLRGIYPPNKTGDFFGSAVDGDDVVFGKYFSCSPRFITKYAHGEYFINGRCIENSNSSSQYTKIVLPLGSTSQISVDNRNVYYYNAAFGEAGFSFIYCKEQNRLIIGAPGKNQWHGALIAINLLIYENNIFSLPTSIASNQNSYYGYSVEWGKFVKNSNKIWYVSGGPRANYLKGNVVFFESSGSFVKEFNGEEIGSYFGASMLVIHKKDGDDILVGAPMYSGDSFDEGCVYYYKNKGNGMFYDAVKLTQKKTSSRFGTVISSVGDIDLDSFKDCAISAPYESDGIGAVYIYFGQEIGFTNNNHYRIDPSYFSVNYPRLIIQGFGLGMSKGNDIDNNKHNDIAVGAYRSGQIFILKTRSIINTKMNLISNMETLYTSTENFTITYCIESKFRNGFTEQAVSFIIGLNLEDERILNKGNISKVISIKPSITFCESKNVVLNKKITNMDPIYILYGYKENVNSSSFKSYSLEIPISYECGTDNVCQTNLSVEATFNPKIITAGLNNELKIEVNIQNTGELAYQTKLYINVPPEINLISSRECDFDNGSYVCLVSEVLKDNANKILFLDVTNLQPSWNIIPISFKVQSIGQDIDPSDNKFQLQIPINIQSNFYINSRSTPTTVFLNKTEDMLQIKHSFLIGNDGPSPLNTNLIILVPQIKFNGNEIIKIKNVEGTVNKIESICTAVKEKYLNINSSSTIESRNNTKIFSCDGSTDRCVGYTCLGGYLPKSNENAFFFVDLVINSRLLGNVAEDQKKIIVATTAYYSNNTRVLSATASTLILIPTEKYPFSFWIYIASISSGIFLLVLLIYLLYKCNFFKRPYKELMEVNSSDQGEAELIEESIDSGSDKE